jgi:hypothetical protein
MFHVEHGRHRGGGCAGFASARQGRICYADEALPMFHVEHPPAGTDAWGRGGFGQRSVTTVPDPGRTAWAPVVRVDRERSTWNIPTRRAPPGQRWPVPDMARWAIRPPPRAPTRSTTFHVEHHPAAPVPTSGPAAKAAPADPAMFHVEQTELPGTRRPPRAVSAELSVTHSHRALIRPAKLLAGREPAGESTTAQRHRGQAGPPPSPPRPATTCSTWNVGGPAYRSGAAADVPRGTHRMQTHRSGAAVHVPRGTCRSRPWPPCRATEVPRGTFRLRPCPPGSNRGRSTWNIEQTTPPRARPAPPHCPPDAHRP